MRQEGITSPKSLTTLAVQRMLLQHNVKVEENAASIDNFWALFQHMKDLDINPWNRAADATFPTAVLMGDQKKAIFSSYSYLGLGHDERVLAAAERAGRTYGAGAHGVRLLTGNLAIHHQLEAQLAALFERESALLFSSGYLCNVGVIPGLVERNDTILVDQFAHASLMQGCQLSGAQTFVFRHNSVLDAEKQLKRARETSRGGRIFIVADSVFSMDGDIFDLPAFDQLCKRESLILILDEAHALGCIGERGLGIEDHFSMPNSVDILLGTLSKGIPSCGGYVAASQKYIEFLRFGSAAPNTFSSPISPYHCGAALAALGILIDSPQILTRLRDNTIRMRDGLIRRGFDIGKSTTPIIPVVLGEENLTLGTWKALFDAGYFTGAVTSPAVGLGRARLRITAHAGHSDAEIDAFLDCLEKCHADVATTLSQRPTSAATA